MTWALGSRRRAQKPCPYYLLYVNIVVVVIVVIVIIIVVTVVVVIVSVKFVIYLTRVRLVCIPGDFQLLIAMELI